MKKIKLDLMERRLIAAIITSYAEGLVCAKPLPGVYDDKRNAVDIEGMVSYDRVYGYNLTEYGMNVLHANKVKVFGSEKLQYLKLDPVYLAYLDDEYSSEDINDCIWRFMEEEATLCHIWEENIPKILIDRDKGISFCCSVYDTPDCVVSDKVNLVLA